MKISTMIQHLHDVYKEYGDIPVVDLDLDDINIIEVHEKPKGFVVMLTWTVMNQDSKTERIADYLSNPEPE